MINNTAVKSVIALANSVRLESHFLCYSANCFCEMKACKGKIGKPKTDPASMLKCLLALYNSRYNTKYLKHLC